MAIRLIVGLGNPGKEYEGTRHNAGFRLAERFADARRVALRKEAKYHGLAGRDEASGAWLLLPMTFMNLSGKSVAALAGFFKIAPAEILVAHDELDFLPGVVKMKLGGGVGGHNGLKDISAQLGTNDYWRLRFGIGHPGDRDVVADYVLSKPSQLDRAAIEETIDRALEILPLAIAGDVERAMHKLHTKPKPPKEAP
ncbi:MAG: aminoacyl-tRNA hydrolase [Betaproteobacteria bacterium]